MEKRDILERNRRTMKPLTLASSDALFLPLSIFEMSLGVSLIWGEDLISTVANRGTPSVSLSGMARTEIQLIFTQTHACMVTSMDLKNREHPPGFGQSFICCPP